MNVNHDNLSNTAPATEATASIGIWQLFKGGFGLGAGWEAGKAVVSLIAGTVAAATAGVAGLGAAAVAGCFGGKKNKEEPQK